jgi:hypothetical protein
MSPFLLGPCAVLMIAHYGLIQARLFPDLRPLRDDPRFADVSNRLELPASASCGVSAALLEA